MAGHSSIKKARRETTLLAMLFAVLMFWGTAAGDAAFRASASEKEIPAILVSSDPGEWNGRLERDDRFKLSTRLFLPNGTKPNGYTTTEGPGLPRVKRVTFVLGTVLSCDASVAADGRTLSLAGRIPDRYNARDIVLSSISLELPDGTVYRQDDIYVCLTETWGYHYYGSTGGCGVGPAIAALLPVALLLLWRRRKVAEKNRQKTG